MLHVRRYVSSDWKQVLAMARQFHAESPVHSPYPFDVGRVRDLLDNASSDRDWLPAVAMDEADLVGIMLLVHLPMFFSRSGEVGDFVFYVAPEKRGTRAAVQLLNYGETWAYALGARVIRIGVTTGIRNEAVLRFMDKMGYQSIGALTEKRL